ncbi:hypothetical protein BWZ20_04555 [Winogradskyella sp. J14-2]|uniref:hypothetical protein n=1 Tax=Winogradskyella sp. J14-2 TaxID=1936080 RepID=UPI000972E5FA|nr:hypothetical protein [Winogradskyella sp. J14-2]APY07613.1 hypothetical protein BWZ20_04555 [Winogradskyella sp. J14-2]
MIHHRKILVSMLLIIVMVSCATNRLQNRDVLEFIPEGYKLYERIDADLNNDKFEDCMLIIKATDSNQMVTNQFDKKVNRNHRGIIILFKKGNRYRLVDKNYDCFYSENEDGGVYYPPQLNVETENGDIIFNYEHGRYGQWSYTFRFIVDSYKLIKYNATRTFGPITKSITELDFLTKQKTYRENTNEDDEGNDEIFKTTKSIININQLIKLSEIKDFEDLDLSNY